MWKQMNAKEKAIMELYKSTTRDPKMQALTGKLYNDWAHERYLEGLPADDWNLFVKDVLTELVKKLGETLNFDVSSWQFVQK